jgi:two-component system OmpR family response regulator
MRKDYTLFIVDDDPMQLEMLKDHLSKFKNFNIKTFSTGEECLMALTEKPDIIILDYNLNSVSKAAINGLDVLKLIKKDAPDAEVIMLSGQEKIEVAVNTMKYGAFDYVVKNESSFFRSENAIVNLLRRFNLTKETKMYKRLAIGFAIAFVVLIVIIAVLFLTGHITNNVGWL